MDEIRLVCQKIHEAMDFKFQYTEANYQRALSSALQNIGFVCQSEVVIPYYILGSYIGSGRADIVAERDGKTYILELKLVTKGYYNADYFKGQCRKYIHHFEKPAEGLVIVFHSSGPAVFEL